MNTRDSHHAHWAAIALLAALILLFATVTASAAQPRYPTPEAAASALNAAVRAGDPHQISAVLGPGSADIVDSGNAGEDMAARARFVAAWEQAMRIERTGSRRADIVLGPQEWRFPFPLLNDHGGWRFDARAGREEVLARRVGRNELSAVQAALAFVDAQREYALEPHDGAGPGLYARRIGSTPGLHDGLFWTPTREHPLSPLGPAFGIAEADRNGEAAIPYHGYYFRVLSAQGPSAAGGALDYVVGGRMIGGFALVAWPAHYRVSGVRTFVVSHEGLVFSRDLGALGEGIAGAMKAYDPAPGWKRETQPPLRADDSGVRRMASEYGCTLCHREAPGPRDTVGTPLAPSWRDIAARYRGRDAETELTRIVMEGADPAERHWRDRHDFTAMGANAPRVTPDQARALVRWILEER